MAVVNVQGLKPHLAALTAHLRLLAEMPDLVCLTETHLDQATEDVQLEGYVLTARRDRVGQRGGGVCAFAKTTLASQVVHLANSEDHERL